ncbi:MAG: hypothetical protein ACRDZU_11075, partial [Acidimicrobiales bacterium]
LLLGACGDDDSSVSSSGDGGNGTEPTADTAPVSPEVESRLLTINAFPDDWEEVETASSDASAEAPGCFSGQDDDQAAARVSREFSAPRGVPQIVHEVTQYDPGEIAGAFADAMEKLDGCDTLNLNSNGTHLEGTVERLDDFPTYGDESAAWQVSLTSEDGELTVTLTVAYVRAGDFGMSLVYTDLDSPDLQEVEQYTALAAAKL